MPDNDVQVAGRRVGRVRDIELTDDNLAAVHVEVEEPYAPLRDGTRAAIRLTSLSGIANRYITLTPGRGRPLDDDTRLDLTATTTVVDLDQLFNTLDERARGDLRRAVRGFARQYEGKGEAAGEAARYFGPVLSTSRQLAGTLAEDEETLTRFLVDSSRLVTALADQRGELSQLVGNANTATRAIAAERAALTRALELLPRHPAPRRLHLRRPARHARRPRRARRGREARHPRPAAVPARAAPAARAGEADAARPAPARHGAPARPTTCSMRRGSCPRSSAPRRRRSAARRAPCSGCSP